MKWVDIVSWMINHSSFIPRLTIHLRVIKLPFVSRSDVSTRIRYVTSMEVEHEVVITPYRGGKQPCWSWLRSMIAIARGSETVAAFRNQKCKWRYALCLVDSEAKSRKRNNSNKRKQSCEKKNGATNRSSSSICIQAERMHIRQRGIRWWLLHALLHKAGGLARKYTF